MTKNRPQYRSATVPNSGTTASERPTTVAPNEEALMLTLNDREKDFLQDFPQTPALVDIFGDEARRAQIRSMNSNWQSLNISNSKIAKVHELILEHCDNYVKSHRGKITYDVFPRIMEEIVVNGKKLTTAEKLCYLNARSSLTPSSVSEGKISLIVELNNRYITPKTDDLKELKKLLTNKVMYSRIVQPFVSAALKLSDGVNGTNNPSDFITLLKKSNLIGETIELELLAGHTETARNLRRLLDNITRSQDNPEQLLQYVQQLPQTSPFLSDPRFGWNRFQTLVEQERETTQKQREAALRSEAVSRINHITLIDFNPNSFNRNTDPNRILYTQINGDIRQIADDLVTLGRITPEQRHALNNNSEALGNLVTEKLLGLRHKGSKKPKFVENLERRVNKIAGVVNSLKEQRNNIIENGITGIQTAITTTNQNVQPNIADLIQIYNDLDENRTPIARKNQNLDGIIAQLNKLKDNIPDATQDQHTRYGQAVDAFQQSLMTFKQRQEEERARQTAQQQRFFNIDTALQTIQQNLGTIANPGITTTNREQTLQALAAIYGDQVNNLNLNTPEGIAEIRNLTNNINTILDQVPEDQRNDLRTRVETIITGESGYLNVRNNQIATDRGNINQTITDLTNLNTEIAELAENLANTQHDNDTLNFDQDALTERFNNTLNNNILNAAARELGIDVPAETLNNPSNYRKFITDNLNNPNIPHHLTPLRDAINNFNTNLQRGINSNEERNTRIDNEKRRQEQLRQQEERYGNIDRFLQTIEQHGQNIVSGTFNPNIATERQEVINALKGIFEDEIAAHNLNTKTELTEIGNIVQTNTDTVLEQIAPERREDTRRRIETAITGGYLAARSRQIDADITDIGATTGLVTDLNNTISELNGRLADSNNDNQEVNPNINDLENRFNQIFTEERLNEIARELGTNISPDIINDNNRYRNYIIGQLQGNNNLPSHLEELRDAIGDFNLSRERFTDVNRERNERINQTKSKEEKAIAVINGEPNGKVNYRPGVKVDDLIPDIIGDPQVLYDSLKVLDPAIDIDFDGDDINTPGNRRRIIDFIDDYDGEVEVIGNLRNRVNGRRDEIKQEIENNISEAIAVINRERENLENSIEVDTDALIGAHKTLTGENITVPDDVENPTDFVIDKMNESLYFNINDDRTDFEEFFKTDNRELQNKAFKAVEDLYETRNKVRDAAKAATIDNAISLLEDFNSQLIANIENNQEITIPIQEVIGAERVVLGNDFTHDDIEDHEQTLDVLHSAMVPEKHISIDGATDDQEERATLAVNNLLNTRERILRGREIDEAITALNAQVGQITENQPNIQTLLDNYKILTGNEIQIQEGQEPDLGDVLRQINDNLGDENLQMEGATQTQNEEAREVARKLYNAGQYLFLKNINTENQKLQTFLVNPEVITAEQLTDFDINTHIRGRLKDLHNLFPDAGFDNMQNATAEQIATTLQNTINVEVDTKFNGNRNNLRTQSLNAFVHNIQTVNELERTLTQEEEREKKEFEDLFGELRRSVDAYKQARSANMPIELEALTQSHVAGEEALEIGKESYDRLFPIINALTNLSEDEAAEATIDLTESQRGVEVRMDGTPLAGVRFGNALRNLSSKEKEEARSLIEEYARARSDLDRARQLVEPVREIENTDPYDRDIRHAFQRTIEAIGEKGEERNELTAIYETFNDPEHSRTESKKQLEKFTKKHKAGLPEEALLLNTLLNAKEENAVLFDELKDTPDKAFEIKDHTTDIALLAIKSAKAKEEKNYPYSSLALQAGKPVLVSVKVEKEQPVSVNVSFLNHLEEVKRKQLAKQVTDDPMSVKDVLTVRRTEGKINEVNVFCNYEGTPSQGDTFSLYVDGKPGLVMVGETNPFDPERPIVVQGFAYKDKDGTETLITPENFEEMKKKIPGCSKMKSCTELYNTAFKEIKVDFHMKDANGKLIETSLDKGMSKGGVKLEFDETVTKETAQLVAAGTAAQMTTIMTTMVNGLTETAAATTEVAATTAAMGTVAVLAAAQAQDNQQISAADKQSNPENKKPENKKSVLAAFGDSDTENTKDYDVHNVNTENHIEIGVKNSPGLP